MSTKYVTDLLRQARKQGAVVITEGRKGARTEVIGPKGRTLVHMSPANTRAGYHGLRKRLRAIGLDF